MQPFLLSVEAGRVTELDLIEAERLADDLEAVKPAPHRDHGRFRQNWEDRETILSASRTLRAMVHCYRRSSTARDVSRASATPSQPSPEPQAQSEPLP